ncbi:helix-turn-helix transcriptional regulator [bacterium]|nr:helix-turn-helix transcriptional regulator [bacterium]
MRSIEETYKQIGKNIKKYREKKGYTQQQLADKVGLGLNFVGKIEVAFSRPSIPTLVLISNVLEIEVAELFRFE